jgi:hypothetical protein
MVEPMKIAAHLFLPRQRGKEWGEGTSLREMLGAFAIVI